VQAQNQRTGGRPDIAFKIKVPLEFKGRAISGSLRQSEIKKLLDLPVRNGVYGTSEPDEGYGAEMMTPAPEYKDFMVYTCNEWKKARADGAYSATTIGAEITSAGIACSHR
jgi:hypothetical protein